jgi:RNA polymerase sigma factor (sigma-70 family)
VGSRTLVEDIVQEVGLAVARTAHIPEPEEELRAWLCTIAIRQCGLALRRAERRQRLVDGAIANATTPDSRLDDPIYWLLSRERTDLVRGALEAMDPEERSLLIWKYVEGRTYGELGRCLRVPPHVVEYRVVTARKRLRGLLIERGLGEDEPT